MSCTQEEWDALKRAELIGKVDYLFSTINTLNERVARLELNVNPKFESLQREKFKYEG